MTCMTVGLSHANEIKLKRIPRHIAIIPDGNRRYAKKHKLTLEQSYRTGVDKVKEFLRWCREFNVKYVTVYALSIENILGRSQSELRIIFDLMERYLKDVKNDKELHENKVKVLIGGSRDLLPRRVIEAINEAERATEGYDKYYLVLLIGYSGRREIIDAIKKILTSKINPDDINDDTIRKFLYLPNVPYPDLVIRTSGEIRISNFLIWQIAYSELYFTEKLWPEFAREDFLKALLEYQRRERRYGK